MGETVKVVTTTGVVLDPDGGMASQATWYAKQKGLENVRCFLATFPDQTKEYVLLRGHEPIYASQQAEAIGVQIDVLAYLSK